MTTICRKCGVVLPGGTLLTHDLAMHPKATLPVTRKGYVCRQLKCIEVYGPLGHVPGLEGPHARNG